jgi:hypothetical protein
MDYFKEKYEQSDNRMKICRACEEFEDFSGRCKQCGCFMRFKTMLKEAKCPLDKWKD